MKAYIIQTPSSELSANAVKTAIQSAKTHNNDFRIQRFIAPKATNEVISELMFDENIVWTYPTEEKRIDPISGLTLTPYVTADLNKRISCFLSHYYLWERCASLNEPCMILEHDVLFLDRVDVDEILNSPFSVVSLNDPRGATRLSGVYHSLLQLSENPIAPVPTIDQSTVPQGLPGNSAYIIKPFAASLLIDLVDKVGAWPNDAIMCKQLMPDQLGCSTRYYTTTQRIQSTTTL